MSTKIDDINNLNEIINAEEGDLVLVIKPKIIKKSNVDVSYLGVFDSLIKDRIYLLMPYELRKTEDDGLKIPIIKRCKYDMDYFSLPKLKEIYFEEDIVPALRRFGGFESHADLISRLEKPYIVNFFE